MSNSEPLVFLQRGYVVPVSAFNLVLRCESLGIRLSIGGGNKLAADGPITLDILSELKRLKPHVIALLQYVPDDRHLRDETIPAPRVGPIHQVSK